MENTIQQYENAIKTCKEIFIKKTKDYGTSWRVLRPISIVDQIYIKAQRIRTVQMKGEQKVEDDVRGEFVGMVNYAVIGLIQLDLKTVEIEEFPSENAEQLYDDHIQIAAKVMVDKNHDYGEAWREMNQESFVDLILMKLLRIRQILQNDGKTIVSEGIESNLIDIINYSLFALILIEEGVHMGETNSGKLIL